jgi:hypothetical protein
MAKKCLPPSGLGRPTLSGDIAMKLDWHIAKLPSLVLFVLVALFSAMPARADIFGPGPAELYAAVAHGLPPFYYIQQNNDAVFSGTSLTVALNGVLSGDDIRFSILMNPSTSTVSSVKIGANSCTVLTNATGGGQEVYIGVCPSTVVTAGSNTVTVTTSAAISNGAILAEEWQGDSTSPLDGGSATYTNASASGTTLPAGSFTPTTYGDFIWCVIWQPQTVVPTVETGYAVYSNGVAGDEIWSEGQTQQIATAINPFWTSGASSFDNYVVAAAFKHS